MWLYIVELSWCLLITMNYGFWMLLKLDTGHYQVLVFHWTVTTTTTLVFDNLFSRTTWVSRYHKGKTSLDLSEARDDGVFWMLWHHLDHMQTICTSLQTDNHTNTPSLNFLQAGCHSWRPPTVSKLYPVTVWTFAILLVKYHCHSSVHLMSYCCMLPVGCVYGFKVYSVVTWAQK